MSQVHHRCGGGEVRSLGTIPNEGDTIRRQIRKLEGPKGLHVCYEASPCGYPATPKIGLRTEAPNEAGHIEVTIIKLLDGTKAYVHAVIDNFSRRVVAWTVAPA